MTADTAVTSLDAAHAWHQADCCVLPARLDGSKAAAELLNAEVAA